MQSQKLRSLEFLPFIFRLRHSSFYSLGTRKGILILRKLEFQERSFDLLKEV